MSKPDVDAVRRYLSDLGNRICGSLESLDSSVTFLEDPWEGAVGISRPRIITGGDIFERAAVNFTAATGKALPAAATGSRPHLAGRGFQAVSLSVIVHPRNPYVPTTHFNLRFFLAENGEDGEEAWWFGGGFDLTPFYGFDEDAVHWHRTAKAACDPFGGEVYAALKRACDDYFFLKHRQEARGVGGLFFDDLNQWGFERCLEFSKSVGDHFLPAYLPIVKRRAHSSYGKREREFQLYRRGRYVEFNLIQDRGTLHGLQSGRRIEPVLASLPPLVRWEYGWKPVPGSEEERLLAQFLTPRDWLSGG